MQLDFAWKAVLIVIMGSLLLRIAGKNSISKITVSEIVLMSTIGPLLSRPIENKGIWTSIGVASILILTLIVFQFLKLKSKLFESLLTGKSTIIIEDGVLIIENLKKTRLTTENLKMYLHQLGINSIEDVASASIEVNGQIGYKLKPNAQPATKQDIQNLERLIETTILKSK
ncbi:MULTISPECIES: YetF domain-containing protein [Bacillaceae]|uniref:YetF C-terminal domain-containing protein n=1 Tax=Gottfriedia luciferensis TaxID=178774 RepID=A0ABX2ZU30_9BACI|nr:MULTISPECIES: YetF domain-containing protein [Bacillaceae]ODG92170.1 hypothetical protein BED47_21100 [Gottfriedia luciferensis]SFC67387.1 Uncharacterized membrane protein YcaP, DUF421 family [Bacillus sp. UNCCL81]